MLLLQCGQMQDTLPLSIFYQDNSNNDDYMRSSNMKRSNNDEGVPNDKESDALHY